MNVALLLGALAWCVAMMIGVAVVGDGPMGPALTLGGFAVLAAVAVGVAIVPRRQRWRGTVRPRSTVRPPFEPNRPLKPAQIAVEARWGVTDQLTDGGWVREVGQLSWRRATVFLVGDNTGLVVEPWFFSRSAYVFDGTCRVGPSPTPPTLNPGLNLRRKNGVLRVSQGTQVVDLAVPKKSLSAVALIGTSAPTDDPLSAPSAVAVSEQRLARIARADRRAARRHAFFAGINAQSRTNRWVAAACSLIYLVPAVGIFIASAQWGQNGDAFAPLSIMCFAAASVYALRVFVQETREPSSDQDQAE